MKKSIHRFKLRMLKKMTFLPAEIYVKHIYEYFTGKKLNLKTPKEFNEKIQWYKVYYQPDLLTKLADKFEVRSYVEEKIGKKYLNELYSVYNKPSEVDIDALPNEFILKATHSSSHNLIVRDKSKINKISTKIKFYKWFFTNQYYRTGKEWAYKNIRPRIIAEKFLEQEGQSSLIDYKFYCFNGKAKFLGVYMDRSNGVKKGFYDVNFNKLPFTNTLDEKKKVLDFKKPESLSEMVVLAEKLADRLPFVRVDFYSIKNKIIFGEMTFYPTDGKKDFKPEKYNNIIGDYLILPKIPRGKKRITEI